MYVTNEEYNELCRTVEFCKVHPDTKLVVEDGDWSVRTNANGEEVEMGIADLLCPKCEYQLSEQEQGHRI